MKLLLDMNLSPRWADVLTDAGFDCVHWTAVGDAAAPDDRIAEFAASHGRVVLTNDLDFGTLLATNAADGPSVVQIRAGDLSPEVLGTRLVASLRQLATELTDGALVTLESDRARVRALPIGRRENPSS